MAGRLVMKMMDADKDTQQISFDGPVADDLNFDAVIGQADALVAAIEGITLGALVSRDFVADRVDNSPVTPPVLIRAQTNVQWIFTYADNVNGRVFTTRVGTADLDAAGVSIVNGVPTLSLAAGLGAALKTAFEAYVRSEDGNAVTLQSVTYRE